MATKKTKIIGGDRADRQAIKSKETRLLVFPDNHMRAITFEKRVWKVWDQVTQSVSPNLILWEAWNMAKNLETEDASQSEEHDIRRCLRMIVLAGEFIEQQEDAPSANDRTFFVETDRWE